MNLITYTDGIIFAARYGHTIAGLLDAFARLAFESSCRADAMWLTFGEESYEMIVFNYWEGKQ